MAGHESASDPFVCYADRTSGEASTQEDGAPQAPLSIKERIAGSLRTMDGLWGEFLPMVALFFFMAFVNTGASRRGLWPPILRATIKRAVASRWSSRVMRSLSRRTARSSRHCFAVIDSLKDTLVVTSVGGGPQVIPFLTVYAVLPASLIFFALYSIGTQRLSRGQMFNTVISAFVCFFVGFAFVAYPNHETLHLSSLDGALSSLPPGLGGLVGMVR